MDVATEAGEPFGNKPRRNDKVLMLSISIVNLYVSSNLGSAARLAGTYLAKAVEQKNKYRVSLPTTISENRVGTYVFLPVRGGKSLSHT